MSVALTSVERINALKQGIEATTGETYADLTAGVQALKNGYGQGGGGGTEEIENLIDESGVLDSTDGTATDKVEQLIDKAQRENVWYKQSENFSTATSLFNKLQNVTVPRTNLINVTQCPNLCLDSSIEYINYYMNTPKCTNFADAFRGTLNLKRMNGINLSKAGNIARLYSGSGIEEIDEPFNLSSIANAGGQTAAFNAPYLVKVFFDTESIKFSITFTSAVLTIGNVFNLNDTENVGSVQSIINGLATLAEGAAAQTLTLSKNLPLTTEQKQAITTAVNNKGWTLAFA